MAARRKRNLSFLPEQHPVEPAVDANGLPLDMGVGELLRMHRESNGQELQSVANQLRVRLVYLQAIEEGRFKDLPGTTYAVGFLRSYADFLGLDSADVVRRFREEVARAHGQPRLVFPNVTAEGKIPGSALLLISVLGAAVVYAAWYYISSRQSVDLPLIAEVPDRLVALPPDESTAATSSTPEPKSTTAEPTTSEQSPSSPAGAAAATEPGMVPSAAPSGTASDVASSTIASNQPQDATSGSGDSNATTAAGEAIDPAPDVTGASTAALPEQPSEPPEPPATTSAVTSPEFIPQAPPVPPEPVVPQVESVTVTEPAQLGPRILIEARIDSWIEILDAEGKVVTAQVLRAGESFAPPDLPGMTLTTGNAGGIDVIVDGAKTPPLGEVGAVMRKVPLEPEKLRAGQSVSE